MGVVTLETWLPTTATQAAHTQCSRASSEPPASNRTFGNKLVSPSIDLIASTLSMFDLRIVEGKIKVGAVILGMALDATDRNRHKAIAFGGILGVSAAGAMAGFALDVGKLRRRIDGLEPARFIPDDVAFDATLVELLIAFF